MRTLNKLAVFGVGMLVTGMVYAGGPDDKIASTNYTAHQGWYLGINGGGTYVIGDNAGSSGIWGGAFSGLLGYQFHPNWAVEAGALYAPGFSWPNVFGMTITNDLFIYYAALKGILPVSDRVDLFAKAGPSLFSAKSCIGFLGSTTCSTDYYVAPYFSAGVGFNATPHLEFTLETGGAIPISTNASFLGDVLAGLVYHFDM